VVQTNLGTSSAAVFIARKRAWSCSQRLSLVHKSAQEMDFSTGVTRQLHAMMCSYLSQPGGDWKSTGQPSWNSYPHNSINRWLLVIYSDILWPSNMIIHVKTVSGKISRWCLSLQFREASYHWRSMWRACALCFSHLGQWFSPRDRHLVSGAKILWTRR